MQRVISSSRSISCSGPRPSASNEIGKTWLRPVKRPVEIPLLGEVRLGVGHDDVLDDLVDPLEDLLAEVVALEHAAALRVDDLALLVEHVVVLEHLLAHVEVHLLDALLGALDALRQHLVLDRLILARAELVEDRVDAVAREEAHELILGREEEARLARVALAAGAAAQLVVDAARLVALGADHVQAALVDHAVAELDVDAAARHVGRDRDRALGARVLDDLGLLALLPRLGVEHVVRDALALEQAGDALRDLDGDRADEHRLALGVPLRDVVDDGAELLVLGLVDQVVLVEARDRHVGRDRHDLEAVDLVELVGLGQRRAGHAGELLVEAEVVLDRDRRDGHVLGLDLDVLLGLDGLVQALRPAAAFHDAARELVDDLDLAVDHEVLDPVAVERLGAQRLDQVVDHLARAGRVEVLDAERLLGLGHALLGRRRGLALLVDLVVLARA